MTETTSEVALEEQIFEAMKTWARALESTTPVLDDIHDVIGLIPEIDADIAWVAVLWLSPHWEALYRTTGLRIDAATDMIKVLGMKELRVFPQVCEKAEWFVGCTKRFSFQGTHLTELLAEVDPQAAERWGQLLHKRYVLGTDTGVSTPPFLQVAQHDSEGLRIGEISGVLYVPRSRPNLADL